VAFSYDYVGYKFNGGNDPTPNHNSIKDCSGHVTKIAGIIAANTETFVGVAPQATLGSYRVFDCTKTTTSDIVLKALRQAEIDGMDIIVLPNIATIVPFTPVLVTVIQRMAKYKNIVFITDAAVEVGNTILHSLYPDIAPFVIFVGGAETLSTSTFTFSTNEEKAVPIRYEAPCPEMQHPPVPAMVVMTYSIYTHHTVRLKRAINANIQGKIAVVRPSMIPISSLAQAAKDAGAIGVIRHQSENTRKPTKYKVPVFILRQEDFEDREGRFKRILYLSLRSEMPARVFLKFFVEM
jgi:hypothetical protein